MSVCPLETSHGETYAGQAAHARLERHGFERVAHNDVFRRVTSPLSIRFNSARRVHRAPKLPIEKHTECSLERHRSPLVVFVATTVLRPGTVEID